MPENVFARHDHRRCIATALAAAETHCVEEKLQFTAVRRRVLEILLQHHKAMGAYDVLEVLSKEGAGRQPPVAYRALDFLVSHGFAHRIERLNAYVACAHPGESHAPAFMICQSCAAVAESATESQALKRAAKEAGFTISHAVIEAEGLCATCREEAPE